MKYLLAALFMTGLLACNQNQNNTQFLQNRIDSLELKIADTYRPGFGEFMSNIQAHHLKLWFAGQAQNWDLAYFEIHEIIEGFEDVEKYQSERKESKCSI